MINPRRGPDTTSTLYRAAGYLVKCASIDFFASLT